MQLQELLYSQGFGTRRICAGLVQQGLVQLREAAQSQMTTCLDATQIVVAEQACFSVKGVVWPFHAKAYIMLNKPPATECSQKPSTYPSVYTLLPSPLRQRPSKGALAGVQAVGRLDQDTTGLLLFSDDGQFIHRMSSPKKHLAKVYRVAAKHQITSDQIERLLAGVILDDDPKPVRASQCVQIDDRNFDLTLTEGKYHQVKRMVAAVSNRVENLRRIRIGGLDLPEDLSPGQWRWLSESDLALLV
ncbi:pseudouridine synthase [Acidovorax sp. GBBC 3334]|uniref:16S rRNA pseudouridine(516) synthase n=1 Tax=unclassified Acidovorax TaxID=2684926 RepID=UPI0023035E6D|nr:MULTISPECIES: 16S rRNA pseudouridine(516) synthase [unclassified Acidovorax]MDA8454094.1 pseudouridine synthase [Acidovorax sp. GBBC 3334]MDA8519965.1 pseudouridine synthase [Acidovorax sp. NCPPB 4044]